MTDENLIFELCDQIRKTSLAAHNYLKHGHAEKVYENALRNRLRKSDLKVEQQYDNSRNSFYKSCASCASLWLNYFLFRHAKELKCLGVI